MRSALPCLAVRRIEHWEPGTPQSLSGGVEQEVEPNDGRCLRRLKWVPSCLMRFSRTAKPPPLLDGVRWRMPRPILAKHLSGQNNDGNIHATTTSQSPKMRARSGPGSRARESRTMPADSLPTAMKARCTSLTQFLFRDCIGGSHEQHRSSHPCLP